MEDGLNGRFPELLKHESTCRTDEGLEMRFVYSPTLAHSITFCDVTNDHNPIHRKLPNMDEAVAPAFIQNVVAILASRRAILEHGLNPIDFPRSSNKVSLDNFVITGGDYDLLVTLRDEPFCVDVKLSDHRGNKVFGMNRTFEEVRPLDDCGQIIYSGSINVDGSVLYDFGEVVGTTSPESNLCALAFSSSVIFDAQSEGVFPELPEGVRPIYRGQDIYMDVGKRASKETKVLLSIPENYNHFDKGDRIQTTVTSLRHGVPVYQIVSGVEFVSERLITLAVRKALRSRARVS